MSPAMEKVVTFIAATFVGLFVMVLVGCIVGPIYIIWGWTGILLSLGAAALWVLLALSILWLTDQRRL